MESKCVASFAESSFVSQFSELSSDNTYMQTPTPKVRRSVKRTRSSKSTKKRRIVNTPEISQFFRKADENEILKTFLSFETSMTLSNVSPIVTKTPMFPTPLSCSSNSFKNGNSTYFDDNCDDSLLSTQVLSPRFRLVFPFSHFNKMQTESFGIIYRKNDNCVVSSPTGSGKTVLFELAIIQSLINGGKVVYLSPTKALCSEKYSNWKLKFKTHKVAMLTGDTDWWEAPSSRKADIIVSTPEKWEVVTRTCFLLLDKISLFLIDEVHQLSPALEVVITRMARIGNGRLRIIAVSATISNLGDFAHWIKLNKQSRLPAKVLRFDDSYRSTPLEKIVCSFPEPTGDPMCFDRYLNNKLATIMKKYNPLRKPVLIFCPTRSSCQKTARYLHGITGLFKKGVKLGIGHKELEKLTSFGIAFHHAGLTQLDRVKIEKAFLNEEISVICCTSTLALGINLPAFLVIIKGTKGWVTDHFEEYSKLDILQMIGRAGRPQYESSGLAVIITSLASREAYETLVSGTERIKSKIHKSVHDYMTVEIMLGNIKTRNDAILWLDSTFWGVSSQTIVEGSTDSTTYASADEEWLQKTAEKIIDELLVSDIIEQDGKGNYRCSPHGITMCKYYVLFSTMKLFLKAQYPLSVREVLDLVCGSNELKEMELKSTQRVFFSRLNKLPQIRFKYTDIDSHSKISLLVQYILAGMDRDKVARKRKTYMQIQADIQNVQSQVPRLVGAIVQITSIRGDAKSLLSSLVLYRSVNGNCWENLQVELTQITGIGIDDARTLVANNVSGIRMLTALTKSQLRYFLGDDSSSSISLIERLPDLQLKVEYLSSDMEKRAVYFTVSIRNRKKGVLWKRRHINVYLVTEVSGETMIDFRKISTNFMSKNKWIKHTFVANIQDVNDKISCHLCTDIIAGIYLKESITLSDHVSLDSMTNVDCSGSRSSSNHGVMEIEDYEPEKESEPVAQGTESTILEMDEDAMTEPEYQVILEKSVLEYN